MLWILNNFISLSLTKRDSFNYSTLLASKTKINARSTYIMKFHYLCFQKEYSESAVAGHRYSGHISDASNVKKMTAYSSPGKS